MEPQQVRATFDNVENYLRRNTSILVRITLINEMVKGLLFRRYAEFGCGDGSIALSLLDREKKLVLVDFSTKMIERAKINSPRPLIDNIEYVVQDIFSYQSDEKFDLILCVGVLAHVPSTEELISKLSSLLTDRGYLIVQFTESRSLGGWLSDKFLSKSQGSYEMNRMSEAFLVPLIKKEHFVLLSKKTYPDSSMWLGKLSVQLAYKLKLLTSKLNLSLLVSERILLFKRVLGG